MRTAEELRKELRGMDRRSYPAYKSLVGTYQFEKYKLIIDHVQGDPFASPSSLHVEMPHRQAGIPERYYESNCGEIALRDYIVREAGRQFEKYNFKYDSDSIREIFASTNPDVVIFTGAQDTHYRWENARKEAVQFSTDLTNILSAYSSVKNGRFLYLSSENVFGKSYPEDVQETESVSANSFHALAVAQGEETCKNYYSTRGMESIVVRIDHLYGTPVKGKMQTDPCFQMTLEMLKSGKIAANGRNLFSMIHQNDAIEFIYRIAVADHLTYPVYQISSGQVISQMQLAKLIIEAAQTGAEVLDETVEMDIGLY